MKTRWWDVNRVIILMVISITIFLFVPALRASTAALPAELHKDIEYGQAGRERLLLDYFVPEGEGQSKVFTVNANGTGDYTTVQAAVEAVPNDNNKPTIIRIKPGTYKEIIVIPRTKRFITFKGENAETTVLTNNLCAGMKDSNGQELGTFRTPSVTIEADDFSAENIIFENTAGDVGQAVAVTVTGDRVVFRNCRFLGWQDTLLDNAGRHYYQNCYVAGHCDFIFGGGTAFFDNCHIHCLDGSYITAASTPENQLYGYVFSNCRITGEPEDSRTYLGRPWRDYANVIFLNTYMSGIIRPQGWHNWEKPQREKTANYAEYNSTGPGANPQARVGWSHQLTKDQAQKITINTVLSGEDGWDPMAEIDSSLSSNVSLYATTEQQGWKKVPGILERIQSPVFPERDFLITNYGARGDGKTDCTQAFAKAIAACSSAGGGRVVIPKGIYRTGAIHLKSNVNLHVTKDAVISFSTNQDDFLPVVYTRFEGTECMNFSPLIYAFEQENIALTGSGTLDGNADNTNWWGWTRTQRPDVTALCTQGDNSVPVRQRLFGAGHKLRPNMIQPYRCKNILIEGVTIKNSPMWHIHPVLSQNITIRNVTVVGHGPNNDGCNPESCRNVLIEGCYFNTGDDCIAIKSGRNTDGRRVNVPSENIVVRNCTMKDGHGGVVLGSEISGSARNVFVEDCLMDSPNLDRGLRIKTNSVRGGVVENIFMRNVTMQQVREAALKINYYYQEGDNGDFQPTVSNIFMTNVRCYKSKYPWHIRGYENNPVRNVVLKNCLFENTQESGVAEGIVDFLVLTLDTKSVSDNWAEKMTYTVIERNPDYWSLDFSDRPKWSYTYGLVFKTMWEVYKKTNDQRIFEYIEGYYERLINDKGKIQTYDIEQYNIDMIKPGSVLIYLYDVTKKEKYKTAILTLIEQMKKQPRTSEGGFWHKQRYPHQMWLDGLYMGSPFLVQYANTFDEPQFFDDVANQIILMEKHARDPETGLLYHAWDESRQQRWADPETGQSPNFWGRAMGWYAMAIVDVLDELPQDHPKRDEIIAILDRMFTALAKVQDPQTGLWYQVLDQGKREGNYLEASASNMYVYAMAKAVRKSYVDIKFLDIARKGYQGILNELVTVDKNGFVNIHQCCSVAGLGGNPYRDGSYEYYISEKIRSNDPKAIGPFIVAGLEFEMTDEK